MRILHVIPYMHPSAGGPPAVVENFVRETIERGHQSEIISTPLFCSNDEDELIQRLNRLVPTTFVFGSRTLVHLQRRAWRKLGESVQAADIVHVHTLWSPLNLMARWECTRYRRPYVLMPHGMLDPYSLSVRYWRKALYFSAIERKNILAARRLIYTTEEEARLAATRVLPQSRGIVIPLGSGAPYENSAVLRSAFLEQFPKARGRRQLLFLGRLHFKKGLDRILTALPSIVRIFPELLLTIAGNGATEFERTLKRAISSLGLENSVMMTGRLDGAVKWGAYASAEIFLLPSRQENFAIAIAEAMQMAVPVIVSNKVNTWPYVQSAGAGIVIEEERIESDLEDAIVLLLRNCESRRLMGKRGQEYARKNLTWAVAATKLLKCYEEVLACREFHNQN